MVTIGSLIVLLIFCSLKIQYASKTSNLVLIVFISDSTEMYPTESYNSKIP